MRKEERGEECVTTTHFKFLPTLVMILINLACMNSGCCLRFKSLWGLYDPSVGSSPPKSRQLPAEMKLKFEYSATKWDWRRPDLP